MFMNQTLGMGAGNSRLHPVQAFTGKGQQQQAPSGNFVDAARAQIEQRVLFDLSDGRAVRALHIVGVNFELRLSIDLRIVGEQQVAVGLLGVGLLRILVHDNAPVEDAVRMAVKNAVVELTAAAMRASMLDVHVVIEMLAALTDEQAVDQTLSAFSGKYWMHVVSDQAASQQKRVRSDVRASLLLNAQRRNVERLLVLALDHVMGDRRIFSG